MSMKIKYFVGLSAALAFDLEDYASMHKNHKKEVTLRSYASAATTYAYGITDVHNTECYGAGFTPFCDEHMFRDICSQPKDPSFDWTALPTEPEGFIEELKSFFSEVLGSTDYDELTWEEFVRQPDAEDMATGYRAWRDQTAKSPEPESRVCVSELFYAKSPFIASAAAIKPYVDMVDNKKCEDPDICITMDDVFTTYRATRDAFSKAGQHWFMSETPDLTESAKVEAFLSGINASIDLGLCQNTTLLEIDITDYADVQLCTMAYNHFSKSPTEMYAALAWPSPKTSRYAGPDGEAPTYTIPMRISRIMSHLYTMKAWDYATNDHADNEAWDVHDVICESTFLPFCDISQAPTTVPTSTPTSTPTGSPTAAPTAAPILTCTGTQLLNESSNECFDICSGATTGRRLADCTDVSGNGVECPTSAPTKVPTPSGVVDFSEATPLQYATALAVAAVASLTV